MDLSELIRNRPETEITLAWTPESSHCQIPEEIPGLAEAIFESRKLQAQVDHANARIRLKRFTYALAAALAIISFLYFRELMDLHQASGITASFPETMAWLGIRLARSVPVGFLLLGYLILVLIPWYQTRKDHAEIIRTASTFTSSVPALRFETWLSFQRAPITRLMLIAILIVYGFQMIGDPSAFSLNHSIHQAGLVKTAYFDGEFWRLLTAPLLHGGLLHFAMNALAWLYLGKRMELLARWPHLPTVFMVSGIAGGIASAYLTPATSVGSSGGLMGWLGFLLVFETLHQRLVPKPVRRRLLGGVFMTGMIGLIGYRFIDNAAHLGGLVSGMVYAAMVFPKSNSPIRPNIIATDRIIGSACLTLFFLSCCLAVTKILS